MITRRYSRLPSSRSHPNARRTIMSACQGGTSKILPALLSFVSRNSAKKSDRGVGSHLIKIGALECRRRRPVNWFARLQLAFSHDFLLQPAVRLGAFSTRPDAFFASL